MVERGRRVKGVVPEFLKLPPLLNDETNSWMRATAGSHRFRFATHCKETVTLFLRITSQARSLPLSLVLLTFVGVKGQSFPGIPKFSSGLHRHCIHAIHIHNPGSHT